MVRLVNDDEAWMGPLEPVDKGGDARDFHRLRPIIRILGVDERVADPKIAHRLGALIDQLAAVDEHRDLASTFNRIRRHVREQDRLAGAAGRDVKRGPAPGPVFFPQALRISFLIVAEDD